MAQIRSFIAVDISPDIRSRIKDLIKRLSRVDDSIKWVDTNQMHLTLKFLGNVHDREIYDVCKAISKAVSGLEPFDIVCSGVGAFPDITRPRTLWVGMTEGHESMQKLNEAIEDAMFELGYPRENRPFKAHLTIGRASNEGRQNPELVKKLQELSEFEAGLCDIAEVTLFSSELTRQGPIYTVLGSAELGGEPLDPLRGIKLEDKRDADEDDDYSSPDTFNFDLDSVEEEDDFADGDFEDDDSDDEDEDDFKSS